MKKFNDIDPNKVDDDPRVILRFPAHRESKIVGTGYFLLRDCDFLIWANKSFYPAMDGNPPCWVGGTLIEFPQKGLSWFINTIEQKFFKSEAEGGLKKGEFSYEEEVAGERLVVARMFGKPGYAFRNYSRKDYLWDDENDPQQASFDDEMLFEKGLFDKFKKIAEKIDKGDL